MEPTESCRALREDAVLPIATEGPALTVDCSAGMDYFSRNQRRVLAET
jgi:hypothetical protein